MSGPLLERFGVSYFRARSAGKERVESVDAVHFLNPEERAGMRRVARGAITRSFLAGAFSGLASAIAEVYASQVYPEEATRLSAQVGFWAIVGGVTLVASVLEVLFLYWDTLRSVHELARVAGLELFSQGPAQADASLVEALARAALELPNPIEGPHGVNARRDASRFQLVAASVAYKAKVGVTNFLVKMLVRRLLGRVFVRSMVNSIIPFVSVPITAAWNAVVTWQVLRESRIRAMGPSATEEMVGQVFWEVPALSLEGRQAALRAVAGAIVRTQDLHPNLVSLLEQVARKTGDIGSAAVDDVDAFLAQLATLSPDEARVTLQILAVACIVDGRISRRERKLWGQALEAAKLPWDIAPLEKLRTAFVRGDGLADDALRSLVPGAAAKTRRPDASGASA